MRTWLLLLLTLFNTIPATTQVTPKKTVPTQKQALPSQNEIQQQMQSAVNELNKQITDLEKQITDAKKSKADLETIKGLEEQRDMLKKQVEMMRGVSKGISKVPDKTFQQAVADDNNTDVPKKDVARIKQLPGKILSDEELVPYVKKIHSEVEKVLNEKDKAEALKIYTTIKSEKKSSNDINNIASNLWMSGYPEIALFIMGKESIGNMKDANILNNYAAFLTMKGGEHAALPILQNLNRNFPNNSTILNNISQAWYGLGEMNNANRYLDSTVKIYKNHSQANETKSKIQKSEGKTQESIESLKRSLKENYTPEKEARLNELGYQVKFEDIEFRYPVKASPLGIERFIFSIPAYPFEGGIAAATSRNEWDDFGKKVSQAIESLESIKKVQKIEADAYEKKLLTNPLLLKPYNNPVCKTAKRKLTLLNEWGVDRLLALNKEFMQDAQIVSQLKENYLNALKNTEDCGAKKELATSYLSQANVIWQDNNAKMLTLQKQLINAGANFILYSTTDRSEYELILTSMKIGFLSYLRGFRPEFEIGCLITEAPESHRGPLPDFDSVNCQYKDEITIPPFTTIKTECNKMITEFDIDTELGLKIKFGLEENLNSGKITKGTLEIGVEAGTDVAKFGPVGAELKGEIGVGVEITSDGVQEVYIKGSSTIDLAGGIDGEFITPAGASDPKGLSAMSGEVKVSWNAGSKNSPSTLNGSLSGDGLLAPVNISLR
jgi:TolA-binding protein